MIGRIRPVLLLLPAALVAAAAGAYAAPSQVGQFRADKAHVVLRGSDGLTYTVDIELDSWTGAPSSGGQQLLVSYTCTKRSRCPVGHQYTLPLSASQVSFPGVNGTTTTLQTRFAGVPLKVTWHQSGSGTDSSTDVNVPDHALTNDPTSSGSADTEVTLFKLTCTGSGSVATKYGAASVPGAPASNAPRAIPASFRARPHHRPGCAPR